MKNKFASCVSYLAVILGKSHAQQAPAKSKSGRNDAPSKRILRSEYNATHLTPYSWWIDWDDVKCVETCDGPPPCGGTPPSSWMRQYSNKNECCTGIYGSPPSKGSPCSERTLREAVQHLIEEESERELIPKFLRLGFHDCVGGCDGCVDLNNADNRGLLEPIEAILGIVNRYKKWYSRADIWAMATLVSADRALMVLDSDGGIVDERPDGIHFPMNYVGRKDCEGANAMGVGGPAIEMPSNDLTTHELLDFFSEEFGFNADETVAIMGAHSVAVATRENVGFGNLGKEEGWVFEAEEYILDNRFFNMLLGEEDDIVGSAPMWQMELVHNDDPQIPNRYQWFHAEEGKDERPIMTNTDMALVRDLSGHLTVDGDGNEGACDCFFKEEKSGESVRKKRKNRKGNSPPICPVASQTITKALEYKMDNELFLYDFETVLEKMINNGYSENELQHVEP